MVARWRLLALAAIGVVTMLWLGPRNDSQANSISDAPLPRDCVAHVGGRCTIDIRYAYPAAEIFVLPEDAYF